MKYEVIYFNATIGWGWTLREKTLDSLFGYGIDFISEIKQNPEEDKLVTYWQVLKNSDQQV